MAKIPIKFKRVALAFDEAARWERPCDSSSGSEYWPESGTDLSDLVNSFIEKGDHGVGHDHSFDFEMDETELYNKDCDNGEDSGEENRVSENDEDKDEKRKEMLQNLLVECRSSGGKKNGIKQKIWDEINVGLKLISGVNNDYNLESRRIKRNVMSHLRDKGFDAGLCKSRWEKTGRFPAGTYEYIDVIVGKTRYIVEVNLAGEFEIARPTNQYTTLLEMIPSILIIKKPQLLKQLMRLMAAAMRDSLKLAKMNVAPWRRNGYLQAKYFSPYKRTTNRESTGKDRTVGEGLAMKRSTVGFEAHHHHHHQMQSSRVSYYCQDRDFGRKVNGVRVGLLGGVLQGN